MPRRASAKISSQHRDKRTRVRSNEVRGRIIKAAIAVFTRDGFKGARMRSIAEDARVTVQLLAYHFQSKEDLWKMGMLEILNKFETLHTMNPIEHSWSATERLRAHISNIVRFTASVPQLHRLMTQETGQLTPRLVWIIDNRIRRQFDEFCDMARAGQREGSVRPTNPTLLYYAVVGIASMSFSAASEYEYLTSKSPFTPSEIEHVIEMINYTVFLRPEAGFK